MNSRGERWCVLPLLVLVGCAEPETAVSNRSVPTADLSLNVAGEGELFGNVYGSSGQKAANVWVKLVPAPGSQPSLLHGTPAAIEWADTASNRNFMFDWADPANTARCGTLAAYNRNNLDARQDEVHRPGPGQAVPSGKEMHCIRPGTYTISFSHNSDGSAPFWTQVVDYLQVPGRIAVSNLTAGLTEYVEYPEYSGSFSGLTDLNVDYTAASPASHADTLDVENAGSSWDDTTFTDNPAPSGTPADWFRFSVARTRSSWNGRGRYLARIYFDYDRDRTKRTHFFNSTSAGYTAIRPHTYLSESGSVTVRAGLEVITPGQAAPDVASTFRTIAINARQYQLLSDDHSPERASTNPRPHLRDGQSPQLLLQRTRRGRHSLGLLVRAILRQSVLVGSLRTLSTIQYDANLAGRRVHGRAPLGGFDQRPPQARQGRRGGMQSLRAASTGRPWRSRDSDGMEFVRRRTMAGFR